MKITYKFATGETVTIETNETLGQEIKEIEREHHRKHRMKKRYCYSMDMASEDGIQYADETSYLDKKLLEQEHLATLRRAMTELSTEQIKLIDSVFFNGRQLKELASELGITYQAVQNRLNKALDRIRKHFTE